MDAEQSVQWTCPAAKVQAVDSMDMVNAHCDDCEAAVNVITQVDEDNSNIAYPKGGPCFPIAHELRSIFATPKLTTQTFLTTQNCCPIILFTNQNCCPTFCWLPPHVCPKIFWPPKIVVPKRFCPRILFLFLFVTPKMLVTLKMLDPPTFIMIWSRLASVYENQV